MIRGLESVFVGSEDPKKLADFYADVVGLKIKEEFESEDGDTSVEMEVGEGSGIYISSEDKINGLAKEPHRLMLNLEVDDAEKEETRLKEAGVKQIEPLFHIEGYGLISTFEDPDGNYFQIVQVRPSA